MTREHNGERWWRENRACFECEGRSIGQWPCDTCDGTGIDPSARGDTSSTADGHADAPERRKCVFCNGSRIVTHSSHGDHYGTRVLPCPSCTDGMLPAGTKVVHPETPRNAELFAKLDALREATFGPEIERCVCGGQPHTVYGGRESWYVDCTDCAWSGDYADTEAGAIDAWNSVMRAARERDELLTNLEAVKAERDDLEEDLAAVVASLDNARTKLAAEGGGMEQLDADSDRLQTERARLQAIIRNQRRELRADLGAAKTERDDARSMVGKLRTKLDTVHYYGVNNHALCGARTDLYSATSDCTEVTCPRCLQSELRDVRRDLATERKRPRPRVRITQCAPRHWRAFFSGVPITTSFTVKLGLVELVRANGFDVEGE